MLLSKLVYALLSFPVRSVLGHCVIFRGMQWFSGGAPWIRDPLKDISCWKNTIWAICR